MAERGNPRWQKGVSGNPGGRSRALSEWRKGPQAQHLRKLAIAALEEAVQKAPEWRDRIVAAKEIWDRVDGKPVQAITGENGGPLKIDVTGGLAETLKRLAGE